MLYLLNILVSNIPTYFAKNVAYHQIIIRKNVAFKRCSQECAVNIIGEVVAEFCICERSEAKETKASLRRAQKALSACIFENR